MKKLYLFLTWVSRNIKITAFFFNKACYNVIKICVFPNISLFLHLQTLHLKADLSYIIACTINNFYTMSNWWDFQVLKLFWLLSFPDRPGERRVLFLPFPDVPVPSKWEHWQAGYRFTVQRERHTLWMCKSASLGWTDTCKRIFTEDTFSNPSLSPLSPSASQPNYDIPYCLQQQRCHFQWFSATSMSGAFLLLKHLCFFSGLSHQLESDITCYILHAGVRAFQTPN